MFSGTSKVLLMEDIIEIESKLNVKLPKQLVNHYLKYNGGIPEKSFFYSEEADIEISVSTFLPIKYDNGLNPTLERNYLFFKDNGIIPQEYVPFALDWGGNLCCINLSSGQIVVIWLDLGEVNHDAIRFVADSFDDFLDGLEDEENC